MGTAPLHWSLDFPERRAVAEASTSRGTPFCHPLEHHGGGMVPSLPTSSPEVAAIAPQPRFPACPCRRAGGAGRAP